MGKSQWIFSKCTLVTARSKGRNEDIFFPSIIDSACFSYFMLHMRGKQSDSDVENLSTNKDSPVYSAFQAPPSSS